MTRMQKFLSYLPWFLVLEIVSMAIGYSTSPNQSNPLIQDWYQGLVKSPLNPPSLVFATLWPILYALIAYALWRVWRLTAFSRPRGYVLFALGHMILNWGWSFAFFGARNIQLGFIWLTAVYVSAIALAIWTKRFDRLAFSALIPYLLWLTFAMYLNGYILAAN